MRTRLAAALLEYLLYNSIKFLRIMFNSFSVSFINSGRGKAVHPKQQLGLPIILNPPSNSSRVSVT